MAEATSTVRDTDAGQLAIETAATTVWRVGFAPEPFAWTPWEYAETGRFDGRWDDPDGTYRTLYLGDSLVGVLLEVLARFRPDLELAAELDAIEEDEGDDADKYPTLPPGCVPRSWLQQRRAGSGVMRGEFVDVRRATTVATLRRRFASLAADLGLPDLDAAALKSIAPRKLTQQMSSWFYRTLRPPVAGVAFGSRHGDDLTMWAVFEQPHDTESASSCLSSLADTPLDEHLPDMVSAMQTHGCDSLSWPHGDGLKWLHRDGVQAAS